MKITWGHGIFVVIIAIVVSFSTVLINSFGDEHTHHLVSKDYYAKELTYQDQIDWTNNAINENKDILVSISDNKVLVVFDSTTKAGKGEILFYRPSNSELDQTFQFDIADRNTFGFDIVNFSKGKYAVKVSWIENNTKYFVEKSLFVP